MVDGGCKNPFKGIVKWEMFPETRTFKAFINSMLDLLSYSKNSILRNRRINDDWKCKEIPFVTFILGLGPFEIFFVFLLRSFNHIEGLRNKRIFFSVLDPLFPYLDFFEYCPKEILVAVNDELETLLSK